MNSLAPISFVHTIATVWLEGSCKYSVYHHSMFLLAIHRDFEAWPHGDFGHSNDNRK